MIKKLIEKYRSFSRPTKASFWFVICSIIQKGIAFFTTPLFTRALSTEAYGTVVVYNSWYEIISIVATLQLATGVFPKAMIKYADDRDGYTSSTLALSSFLTLLWMLVYFIFSKVLVVFIGLSTELTILMFLDIFFSNAMAFYSVRNRFEYRYKSIVFITILTNITGPLLSVFLILSVSSDNQPLAKVLGILIVKILLYSYAFYKIFRNGKTIVCKEYWKYAIWYNIPLIPHYLSQQVLSQSDRIMISRMCNLSDAGIYGVAYQLSTSIFIFTLAVHYSFTPWTYENLKAEEYEKIGNVALKFEAAVGAACFLFSLFAPELIRIIGGKQYMQAMWIVPSVAMSVLFQTVYTFFANVEFYYEKTKFVMIASVFVAGLNIILNYIFISKYGFVAAGYTTLFCYIVYSVIHFVFMNYTLRQKNIKPFYNVKKVWGIGILFVIASLFVNILFVNSILRYMVIFIGFIVIVLLVYKYKNEIIKQFRSK